jgi:hypothetical protein
MIFARVIKKVTIQTRILMRVNDGTINNYIGTNKSCTQGLSITLNLVDYMTGVTVTTLSCT